MVERSAILLSYMVSMRSLLARSIFMVLSWFSNVSRSFVREGVKQYVEGREMEEAKESERESE